MSRRRNTLREEQGDPALAQYFTPRPVAEFIWQAARLYAGKRLNENSRVIDPAAGRGVFLEVIAAEGDISARQLYGVEIDPTLGSGRSVNAQGGHFYCGDGLLDSFPGVAPGCFDAAVGNPPFGLVRNILPQAVGREEWGRFAILHAGLSGGRKEEIDRRVGRCPLELLFLERALELVVPEGLVAFVLPEGFFANTRLQWARDWVRQRAQVLGIVSLPEGVFRRTGLSARAGVAFLKRRRGTERSVKTLLMCPPVDKVVVLDEYLEQGLRAVQRQVQEGRRRIAGGKLLAEERLAGKRWDAGYWQGKETRLAVDRRFTLVRLGDFIQHLTYGPIVTGCRPRHVGDGIRVIRQGDFTETGLCGEQGLRVEPGSPFDPPRSRVRQGDWLVPRSGAGALGRNRMAVYLHEEPANVGCFVDLVRLEELNPFYVWFFFKSRPGWRQIQALINGVGTPNINFSEIRSLRIPSVPIPEQEHLERRYFDEVWPLHCRRCESVELRGEGERRFRRIVGDLEAFLVGQRANPAACL